MFVLALQERWTKIEEMSGWGRPQEGREGREMMISGRQIDQVLHVYIQQESQGKQRPGGTDAQPVDSLTLSQRGQEVQKAKQALANAPEVRPEKVAALRRMVAQGTYHPPGRQVAEKMLGRSLVDRLA